MNKKEWLVVMALAVGTFTLTACAGKENKQTSADHEEDTVVGICPCCEAELDVEVFDDSVDMVMDN